MDRIILLTFVVCSLSVASLQATNSNHLNGVETALEELFPEILDSVPPFSKIPPPLAEDPRSLEDSLSHDLSPIREESSSLSEEGKEEKEVKEVKNYKTKNHNPLLKKHSRGFKYYTTLLSLYEPLSAEKKEALITKKHYKKGCAIGEEQDDFARNLLKIINQDKENPITGDGLRQSLQMLSKHIKLKEHKLLFLSIGRAVSRVDPKTLQRKRNKRNKDNAS